MTAHNPHSDNETSKYDASNLHDRVHCGIYAHCSFSPRALNVE